MSAWMSHRSIPHNFATPVKMGCIFTRKLLKHRYNKILFDWEEHNEEWRKLNEESCQVGWPPPLKAGRPKKQAKTGMPPTLGAINTSHQIHHPEVQCPICLNVQSSWQLVGITSVLNVAVSGYKLTAACSRAHAAIQITSRTTATLNYRSEMPHWSFWWLLETYKGPTDRFDGYWKPSGHMHTLQVFEGSRTPCTLTVDV